MLSDALIAALDKLKPVYGVRSRGAVVEQLLEHLLKEDDDDDQSVTDTDSAGSIEASEEIQETSSLVLIQKSSDSEIDASTTTQSHSPVSSTPETSDTGGIELPGFVRRRTQQLKQTLASARTSNTRESAQSEPIVSAVEYADLKSAEQAAASHWLSLYGNEPGSTVIEAAVIWLGRDLWPNVEASDGRPFTWTGANAAVHDLCPTWSVQPPDLGRVMVVAGTLEDPFATGTLAERMPTMIRRFVNRFRRSKKVTSFETLESTMTVHGALRLLGLSTQPGAEVTLQSIKEAYKTSAKNAHPDTGGSQESMRRVSEAYQLLSGVYRQSDKS